MNIQVLSPRPISSLSVKIHGISTPPAGDTLVLKVRGYGHDVAVKLFGLDTTLTKDNFNHVDYYDPVGRWSAVTKFYADVQDILPFLRALHPVWTNEMENWLMGDITEGGVPSRPMWWANNNQNQRVLRCGTSVFGENVVMVEARNGLPVEYVYDDLYPAEPSTTRVHPIPFYRVIGMRKSDLGKVTHQSHPWLVHRCNQANSNPVPNTIDWYPKCTTIYYPVLEYADWMPNTKATMMLLPKVMFYEESAL